MIKSQQINSFSTNKKTENMNQTKQKKILIHTKMRTFAIAQFETKKKQIRNKNNKQTIKTIKTPKKDTQTYKVKTIFLL